MVSLTKDEIEKLYYDPNSFDFEIEYWNKIYLYSKEFVNNQLQKYDPKTFSYWSRFVPVGNKLADIIYGLQTSSFEIKVSDILTNNKRTISKIGNFYALERIKNKPN